MTSTKHRGPSGTGAFVTNDHSAMGLATEAYVAAAIAKAMGQPVPGPDPTPVPVPPPPPAPGRRYALPNTVRTIQIPPSINQAAGDVTADLKRFLAGIPDGTLILGDPTATYLTTGSCLPPMAGHNHWILDWLGAKMLNSAKSPIAGGPTGSDEYAMSGFWCHWTDKPFATHITIRNLRYRAANPNPGVLNGHEYAAVAHLMGADYVELDNIEAAGTWGDLATFNEDAQYGYVHNSKTTDVGRNNVSIVCGSHIYVEDNAFGRAGYCVNDIEPEPGSIADIDDVVIRRNTDQGLTPTSPQRDLWLAIDGVNSGKKVTNVVVDANISAGQLTMLLGGDTGGVAKARPGHVTITGNAGAAGGYITARHIDAFIARGNTQAGKLLAATASSDSPSPVLS